VGKLCGPEAFTALFLPHHVNSPIVWAGYLYNTIAETIPSSWDIKTKNSVFWLDNENENESYKYYILIEYYN